jgi:hypothetical protein
MICVDTTGAIVRDQNSYSWPHSVDYTTCLQTEDQRWIGANNCNPSCRLTDSFPPAARALDSVCFSANENYGQCISAFVGGGIDGVTSPQVTNCCDGLSGGCDAEDIQWTSSCASLYQTEGTCDAHCDPETNVCERCEWNETPGSCTPTDTCSWTQSCANGNPNCATSICDYN